MSTTGTLTSLLVGKNDADLTPISLANAGVLTWTHGVGTKQGFGGRAVAIRVWSWDPAGGATVGQKPRSKRWLARGYASRSTRCGWNC